MARDKDYEEQKKKWEKIQERVEMGLTRKDAEAIRLAWPYEKEGIKMPNYMYGWPIGDPQENPELGFPNPEPSPEVSQQNDNRQDQVEQVVEALMSLNQELEKQGLVLRQLTNHLELASKYIDTLDQHHTSIQRTVASLTRTLTGVLPRSR